MGRGGGSRSCWWSWVSWSSGIGQFLRLEDLEFATLDWVDWFNNRRLFEAHGHIPPAEFEKISNDQQVSRHQAETQTRESA